MKKIQFFTIVLVAFLFSGCATIPKESVTLSNEVGIGLKKQYQSQVDLVNLYFSTKRDKLDELMENAINTYFKGLTSAGDVTLSKSQLNDVKTDIMSYVTKNNQMKEELEKTRLLIIKKFDENYLSLNQANSTITGLLQSAVDVKEANSKAFELISNETKGKVDLDKIFSKLDEVVLKSGDKSEKVLHLLKEVSAIMNKNEEEKK